MHKIWLPLTSITEIGVMWNYTCQKKGGVRGDSLFTFISFISETFSVCQSLLVGVVMLMQLMCLFVFSLYKLDQRNNILSFYSQVILMVQFLFSLQGDPCSNSDVICIHFLIKTKHNCSWTWLLMITIDILRMEKSSFDILMNFFCVQWVTWGSTQLCWPKVDVQCVNSATDFETNTIY